MNWSVEELFMGGSTVSGSRNGRECVWQGPTKRVCMAKEADIKLSRLRPGHCGLTSGLALVGKETERNMLTIMLCPAYTKLRKLTFVELEKTGLQFFSLRTILGRREGVLAGIRFLLGTSRHSIIRV